MIHFKHSLLVDSAIIEPKNCSIIDKRLIIFATLLYLTLKWYYDENRIFAVESILKHKQVVCMR